MPPPAARQKAGETDIFKLDGTDICTLGLHIDFTLLQALANLPESDTRRRGIVYAFSGARPADISLPGVTAIALDLTAIFTLALLELLPVVIDAHQRVAIPHSTLGWLFQERQRITFHQPSRIKEAHDLKRTCCRRRPEGAAGATALRSESCEGSRP